MSLEDRLEMIHGRTVATDHQAVASVDAPNAAADADVNVMDTASAQGPRASNVVDVVRVSAINDDISWLELGREIL
jgi:hypothetical protein